MDDDVVFMPEHLRYPLPASTPETIALIEQEIRNILTIPGRLLEELEGMVTDPKKYSPHVGQLRDYAKYLDALISEAALEVSGRNLTPQESARVASLVRLSKLGQVLADQTGELVEIVHQIQEKGIVLTDASRQAIQHTLIPCSMNLKTLADNFPKISDPINKAMREQDDLLRDTVTAQYRDYLDRFASHKTPSGSEFSRVLFQIEGMAATIREIRKSTRLL
jgi:Na+/phosphate symporter